MSPQCLALIVLLYSSCLLASEDSQEAFTLLNLDRQKIDSLPFFVRHMPAGAATSSDQSIEFKPLPKDISAHLIEVGYLGGRSLVAVRYLSDERLVHGNSGAVGLILLCSVQSDPPKFAPLIVEWDEDGEIIDDFSVSPIQQFDDFSFIWVRRDYSGTANTIDRTALIAPDTSSPPRAYPLFSDQDPLAELAKEGWELWHRGSFFDEETLTWHYHLYRDPTKASSKDDYPHRLVHVRYRFRDGKLFPDKVEDDEN